jgi:hypothetical protein
MGHPNSYHGTMAEILFMRALGPRGRFTRLQMLQRYRATLDLREQWESINRPQLVRETDREIAAEVKKTVRLAA